MVTKKIGLSASTVSSGLMAGLLYGWTVSVIPGLRRIPDTAYITTMQKINRAIINPAFIVPFMGLPIALTAGAITRHRAGDTRRAWLLAGAAATYTTGVLGVTIGRNVPLNNALDAFDLTSASKNAIAKRRQSYETPWNRWHYLRTAASIASFVLAAAAAKATTDASPPKSSNGRSNAATSQPTSTLDSSSKRSLGRSGSGSC